MDEVAKALCRDPHAPPQLPPMPDAPPLSTNPTASLPVVVYVEDQRLNALFTLEALRSHPGWRVEAAESGEAAWRLLESLHPRILLTDVHLPDIDGFELVRRVRADPSLAATRCVALSADAMPAQIEAALARGFDAYWTKPVDILALLEGLQALLAEPGSPVRARFGVGPARG